MSHFIFAIAVNALKEQINRAYEEDNGEDEKVKHLSEVNLTFDNERVGRVNKVGFGRRDSCG